MVHISNEERRRAFTRWLRTGRLPSVNDAHGVELKFNPWHDPNDGRFTSAGAGHNFGQGDGGESGRRGARTQQEHGREPTAPQSRRVSDATTRVGVNPAQSPPSLQSDGKSKIPSRGRWGGGGFTGGGGGSFGGGGANSTEPWPGQSSTTRGASDSATTNGGAISAKNVRPSAAGAERFRTETRNGYIYEADADGRTRLAFGDLTVAGKQVRSRSSQTQAGGADRRSTDDGGHYIAARFNGPAAAINHFAQDENFNRGAYRVLENDWARAKRAGKKVTVKIVPVYNGASTRPSSLNVWFTVDGKLGSQKFPNEPREKRGGK